MSMTIVEKTPEFFKWRRKALEVKTKKIDLRMKRVIEGILEGISIETALSICNVSITEYLSWVKVGENAQKVSGAIAMSEGVLEHVVYQASLQDPKLALQLLKTRSTRKILEEMDQSKPEVKTLSKTMKRRKEIIWDVEVDD